MATPNRIVNLLNRVPRTVSQLAEELSISRNSVHQQVSRLEAAGVLEKIAPSKIVGAGKPAYKYRTVPGREDSFSTAYKPVMDVIMQTLSEELPVKSRIKFLEKTGRSLARSAGLRSSGNLDRDLKKSLEAVNAMGAMAELTCTNDERSISCHSCPVGTLVHSEPMTCQMVAAFFSEAVGRSVSVKCSRKETVICGFEVAPN